MLVWLSHDTLARKPTFDARLPIFGLVEHKFALRRLFGKQILVAHRLTFIAGLFAVAEPIIYMSGGAGGAARESQVSESEARRTLFRALVHGRHDSATG